MELEDHIPEGDAELAALMRKHDHGSPVEKITATDWLATSINRDRLGPDMRRRIVDLECGHSVVTTNQRTAQCPYCHYLILNGYDYDAYRNLKTIRDPLEGYWESVDLKGY